MDVRFLHQNALFVWDEAKAIENKRKHGITFEQACEIFIDPFCEFIDASILTEAREAAIGSTYDQTLLFVVNIVLEEDEEDAVRIISARRATTKEQRFHENHE